MASKVVLTNATVVKDITEEGKEYGKNQEGKTSWARLRVAVDKAYKKNRAEGEPTTNFWQVIGYGAIAEFMVNNCKKGKTFDFLDCNLDQSVYTNKEGKKVYNTDIVCTGFPEFSKGSARTQQTSEAPASAPASQDESFMNIPDGVDEELPWLQ